MRKNINIVEGTSALKADPDLGILDKPGAGDLALEDEEESDDEFYDLLSESSDNEDRDASEGSSSESAEKEAFVSVLNTIQKTERNASYCDTDTVLGEEPAPDIKAAYEYADNSVISYPGQHRSKRYHCYGCYDYEFHKIPMSRQKDYAYRTADNAIITVDPDLDEGVTPEMIYTLHRLRDKEVRKNNKVTKRIPPKEKKALTEEYAKKKNHQPNCYDDMKKELNATYTFAHYDAWVDEEGNSLLDHLPSMASPYKESPDYIAIQKVTYEHIAEILNREILKMDNMTQWVIYLRFFRHMTNTAIGKELHISESYVRELTAKALRKLRRPGAYFNSPSASKP